MPRRELDDNYGREASIDGPLFQDSGPFAASLIPPTDDERRVALLISQFRGKEHPVSIAQIRVQTGLSERQIKGIVEQLVVTHRIQIGGRREEPVGYFIIETAEDREAAVTPYKRQILAMLRRLRVLESKQALSEFVGQLELEAGCREQI